MTGSSKGKIRISALYAVLLVILVLPVIYLGLFFQPMYELSIGRFLDDP